MVVFFLSLVPEGGVFVFVRVSLYVTYLRKYLIGLVWLVMGNCLEIYACTLVFRHLFRNCCLKKKTFMKVLECGN